MRYISEESWVSAWEVFLGCVFRMRDVYMYKCLSKEDLEYLYAGARAVERSRTGRAMT